MADLNEKTMAELDALIKHGRRTRKLRLSWTSALAACEIGDYQIIPLTTSSELRKEGAAMNHCVGSHDVLCAVGSCLVFSIRDLDNRRLATMSLVFGQYGWRLDQIKGYENTEVIFTEETFYSGERTETVRDYTDLYFIAQEILRQYRLHTL
jgi:hypothetical protein